MTRIKLLLILTSAIQLGLAQHNNNNNMETPLLSEFISPAKDAKTIVLFGGNPQRRHEVIKLLMNLDGVSIYGTLSEEEGMSKLKQLARVDLVLIGGRYNEEQRVRIRSFIKSNLPATACTEPGYDYPYDNREILKQIKEKLAL